MIILAGVSLNLVLGQNGIIQRAKDAKMQQKVGEVKEEISIKILEKEMEKVETEGKLYQEEIETILSTYGTVNKNADGTIKSLTVKDTSYEISYENLYVGETIKSYDNIKKVNTPVLLTGMTPIKFTEATQTAVGQAVTTNINDTNWYNYTSKKWANAQTEDGSMWVWIPRFAYKLNNSTQTTEVVFLMGTENKYYDETNNVIKDAVSEGYTVHPAFTKDIANGGWDKELTGIWVAKFEAGYASGGNTSQVKASNVKYTQTNAWVANIEAGTTNDSNQSARNWLDGIYGSRETKIKYPVFQGSTYSMNYINHNDTYSISRALTNSGNIYGLSSSNADSHLMKNSEWGAVAYLSKSQYGLESADIAVNTKNLNSGNSPTTKENGNEIASVYAVTGYNANNNKWNEYLGTNSSASTTGNIYGIYDMSGGTWERTAGIVSNGDGNLYTYGKEIIDEANVRYTVNQETKAVTVNKGTGASTKYVTIYPSKTSESGNIDTASQENYTENTNIYGDGVRETSTAGTGYTSWYGDSSYFPALYSPFFERGGGWGSASGVGLFYFGRGRGDSSYGTGFRSVLVAR